MPDRVQYTGSQLSLQDTFFASVAVVASPAAAAETTICTVTVTTAPRADQSVWLIGGAAFTVGTSGTAARLRVRRTDTSGATKADTGATTGGIAATNLVDMNVIGVDALGAVGPQVYVLTLTITAGAAASAVSSAALLAIII